MRIRTATVFILMGVLLSQLAFALANNYLADNEAVAAQEFTRETVKSVPESFVDGGNRSLRALEELNKTMLKNGRKLDNIAEELDQINTNLKRLLEGR